MPSSISNSEVRRVPEVRWAGTWLVTLALVLAMLWWFEHTTRAHGQRPSVVDDPVWWSVYRRSVDRDSRAVAFVGTSRLKLAYSARAFERAAPDMRGVQLAIDGVQAFGVLEDLANDEDFHGIAVVDVAEWDFDRVDAFTIGDSYVARFHSLWRAPGSLANRELATYAQAHLAVLAMGGRQLIASLLGKRRWPEPTWVVADRDRTSRGAYGLAPASVLEERREKTLHLIPDAAPSPEVWLAREHRIEDSVRRIKSRGGAVVFVHLPISGRLADAVEHAYPRSRYWDTFAARSSAKVIHFRDVPGMASLTCPDSMHLDQVDQDAFTEALVGELKRLGVIRIAK